MCKSVVGEGSGRAFSCRYVIRGRLFHEGSPSHLSRRHPTRSPRKFFHPTSPPSPLTPSFFPLTSTKSCADRPLLRLTRSLFPLTRSGSPVTLGDIRSKKLLHLCRIFLSLESALRPRRSARLHQATFFVRGFSGNTDRTSVQSQTRCAGRRGRGRIRFPLR